MVLHRRDVSLGADNGVGGVVTGCYAADCGASGAFLLAAIVLAGVAFLFTAAFPRAMFVLLTCVCISIVIAIWMGKL